MARRRQEKKRRPAIPADPRVLPMELQIGDRFSDETGHSFNTAAGKNAHARVRKAGQPEITDLRSWSAHEQISVKRA